MAVAVPFIINAAIGMAVSYLLAPDGPDIEGPRLADRGVQTNSYGAPVNLVYGRIVVAGTLIFLENNQLAEKRHKESTGKGGGGGSVTSYTYSATYTVAICEGTISGVGRIWADTTLVAGAVTSTNTLTAAQQAALQLGKGRLSSGFIV